MGRRTLLRRLSQLLAALAATAVVAVVVLLALQARAPANRRPPKERMASCPSTPNCVVSLTAEPRHAIEPLDFSGDPADAWEGLRSVVETLPRTRIRIDEPDYLAAECESRLFRFVDDLEFRLDRGAGVIQVRSAARVGTSDLGVNRRRVERVRELFEP